MLSRPRPQTVTELDPVYTFFNALGSTETPTTQMTVLGGSNCKNCVRKNGLSRAIHVEINVRKLFWAPDDLQIEIIFALLKRYRWLASPGF